MELSALKLTKFVASGIVGIGSGKIVGAIIKNNVTPENLIDRVTVAGAGWAMGGIVAQATKKHTNEAIDDVYTIFTKVKESIELGGKLGRIDAGLSSFEKEGLIEADFEKNEKGHWKPKKKDYKPVEDETFEKMNRDAEEAGLSVSFKKVDGKWMLVDN